VVLGCSGSATDERPNIVLIMVDTLSFHEVGHLGGAQSTVSIDRLAAQSTTFTRAYSTSSWTQPAVASLFTGLYPTRHGVDRVFEALPESVVTVAEQLSSAGYETAGIVSNYLLRHTFGLAQGFRSWDQRFTGLVKDPSAHHVTAAAIDWLDGAPRNRPFFLYVHYMDPHFPYLQHPGLTEVTDYDGPLRPDTTRRELRSLMSGLDREDFEYWRSLYRGEVKFTDLHVGRLLDAIENLAGEETIVIVTSDHGEEFFEHAGFEHIRTLYDELARVVLIVRWPEGTGQAVDVPVSLLAVAPTILEEAGLQSPRRLDSRSLGDLARASGSARSSPVFLETDFVPHRAMGDAFDPGLEVDRTAMVAGTLKMMHDLRARRWSLFDLAADPGEQRDLYETHERAAELRDTLGAWEDWTSRTAAGSKEVDPRDTDLDSLRALGYVD
jgi:arylsulfatase A-like enzyme